MNSTIPPQSHEQVSGAQTSLNFISKRTKAKKPNYYAIHSDPLPITLQSSPPLIPHNPLSILHHLYLYVVQYFLYPVPQRKYEAVFSSVTTSIEVTEPNAVIDLWQRGFWGKGSLSRSEPTWLQREKRRLGEAGVVETSEEITRRRRNERKEMKKERARKEKEDLEKIKNKEAKGDLKDTVSPRSPAPLSTTTIIHEHKNGERITKPKQSSEETIVHSPSIITIESTTDHEYNSIQDRECLQLTLYEAFFLSYALDILSVTVPKDSLPLSNIELLDLCLRYSHFPPLAKSSGPVPLDPGNAFLANYAVYHHFRSLGWVVKSGVKFSVDFLLYRRGPVFSHAEFAILAIPCFSQWEIEHGTKKEWNWLHSITRVNNQVKKTVVLVYVEIPTPAQIRGWDTTPNGIKYLLGKYRLQEVALKRWVPGRNRE